MRISSTPINKALNFSCRSNPQPLSKGAYCQKKGERGRDKKYCSSNGRRNNRSTMESKTSPFQVHIECRPLKSSQRFRECHETIYRFCSKGRLIKTRERAIYTYLLPGSNATPHPPSRGAWYLDREKEGGVLRPDSQPSEFSPFQVIKSVAPWWKEKCEIIMSSPLSGRGRLVTIHLSIYMLFLGLLINTAKPPPFLIPKPPPLGAYCQDKVKGGESCLPSKGGLNPIVGLTSSLFQWLLRASPLEMEETNRMVFLLLKISQGATRNNSPVLYLYLCWVSPFLTAKPLKD